jgi:hypothetical protein
MSNRQLVVQLPAELSDDRVAELAHVVHAVLIACGLGGRATIHLVDQETAPKGM